MDVRKFYEEQLAEWPEFRQRVEQLEQVELREFRLNGFTIKAQFNPARAVSSGAKLDKESIAKRKCFLCSENRPEVQRGLKLNDRFMLLVNPFPILKEHFTIACDTHCPQEIKPNLGDMLDFAQMMPDHIIFYNGPRCGASAPDHLHFQAVAKGQLPLEQEWRKAEKRELSEWNGHRMEQLMGFGRSCVHAESDRKDALASLFNQTYTQYMMMEGGNEEPRLNLFAMYEEGRWHLFIFPRKTHRPTQYYAEGEAYRMISPGAIDMAGVLVLPRKADFEALTLSELKDVYLQVSL
ncbi:MAG: DUF4922 domain-containing protein [Paludibacteraceae bacterium]|nr:DUF4922 domain-containing protein [Paludibacteraceae bacterium]